MDEPSKKNKKKSGRERVRVQALLRKQTSIMSVSPRSPAKATAARSLSQSPLPSLPEFQ